MSQKPPSSNESEQDEDASNPASLFPVHSIPGQRQYFNNQIENITSGQLPVIVREVIHHHNYYIYGGQFGAVINQGSQSNSYQTQNADVTSPDPQQNNQNTQTNSKDIFSDAVATNVPALTSLHTEFLFSSIQSVEDWFFGMDENDTLAFEKQLHLLVMSVFSGNSVRFINRVKTSLLEKLQPALADATQAHRQRNYNQHTNNASLPAVTVFNRQVSEVLSATMTRANHVIQGRGMTQVYEFIHSSAQLTVLHFLSTSPDLLAFRQEFSQWLTGLSSADDNQLLELDASLGNLTRIQAAIGLGEFAKHDFNHYYERMIYPAAKRAPDRLHEKTFIGWMLFQIATDPHYTATIYGVLEEWASDDKTSSEWLGWTATLVCYPLGLLDTTRILPVLEMLNAQRSILIRLVMPYTLAMLYSAAYRAHLLLDAFADWQRKPLDRPDNANRAYLGLIYFLMLIEGKVMLNDTGVDTSSANMIPHIIQDINAHQSQAANLQFTIWDIILRSNQTGSQHPEASVEYLIKCILRCPEATLVDKGIAILEHWVQDADTCLAHQQEDLWKTIYYVLNEVKQDRYGYRVLTRLCQQRSFHHSPTAQRLLLE